MGATGHAEDKARCCLGHVLAIHLAVACLVVSLASRVFLSSPSPAVTAQCHAPKAKIQHLAQDAVAWAAPVDGLLPPWFPTPNRIVIDVDRPVLPWYLQGSLYDRPPPIS